jgi:Malonate decarboxylase gamma subunit
VASDRDALRAWVRVAAGGKVPFAEHVIHTHAMLARRAPPSPPPPPYPLLSRIEGARCVDGTGWLWRAGPIFLTTPADGLAFGAGLVHALDSALLAHLCADRGDAAATLAVVEDSAGHEVSRAAEMRFAPRWLAHHAAVLALVRVRGRRLTGLLAGTGHSAAFFANALQAPRLFALPTARVIAMEPSAIARVTGLPAATLIEDDPLLGHPVRHLAALGGASIVDETDVFAVLSGARAEPE